MKCVSENISYIDDSMKQTAGSLQGISLLRDHLLPNILGEETSDLLYWAGKELARSFPLEDREAMIDFFLNHQFGQLTLMKEAKKRKLFNLSGDIVSMRLKEKSAHFSLEAGFLAQQYQMLHQIYCEATFEVNLREQSVQLILVMDPKETVQTEWMS